MRFVAKLLFIVIVGSAVAAGIAQSHSEAPLLIDGAPAKVAASG